MPTLWIPALLRDLTDGQETLSLPGGTVREMLDALEARHPGAKARLMRGDALRPGLAIVIHSQYARPDLDQAVAENAEVHIIPAIAGGA